MAKEINVRELAAQTLTEIDRGQETSSTAMGKVLRNYQYMSKQDRSFYTRLCYGTLESRIRLDYMIDQVSKTKVASCRPYIRNLLRMSLYQICYMGGVPDEAACNEAVLLAKRKGFASLSGFVNGVLRNLVRKKGTFEFPDREEHRESYLSVRYSMPLWLVERMLDWYPEELAETIMQAFLQEPPLTVRVNLARTDKEALRAMLHADGIQTRDGYYTDNTLQISGLNYLNRIRAFREGLFTIQDESSVLQGCLAPVHAGDRILDVCAAPGGKSLHAAERLYLAGGVKQTADANGTGMVLARDIGPEKTGRIHENIERMKYTNITVEEWDARRLDERSLASFDIVFADVPCSGLGVLGRKPDIKYRLTTGQMNDLLSLQREILSTTCRYVKKDGYLIYSTCTINPEENVGQVAWIRNHVSLEPVSLRKCLPQHLAEQLDGQPGSDLDAGYATLLPGRQQCDGFFFAVLRRNGD